MSKWWTRSWNPVTGCTKVSEACAHCWAEAMSKRLAGRYGYPLDGPFRVTLHPERLDEPKGWAKAERIFVVNMGDLMHPAVRDQYIHLVLETIDASSWHTFYVLTKRPDRMLAISQQRRGWPQNCWAGVTIENQAHVDRLKWLAQIPAPVRFVSCEPLLSSLDLALDLVEELPEGDQFYWHGRDCTNYCDYACNGAWYPGRRPVDLVIAGCESGPGRRPSEVQWFRDLRRDCVDAKVSFYLKQMEIGKKVVALPELDGRQWAEWPEAPNGV